MNKYMEQNCRIENIFFFKIPSQHFLNVAVTGSKSIAQTPVMPRRKHRSFCCTTCLPPHVPTPTVGKSGSHHHWMLQQKQLPHLTRARYWYLEPKHWPMWHIWQEVKLILVFISEAFTWYHWLSHLCCPLWQPTRHSFCVLFRFQVDDGSLLTEINKPLPPVP